MLLLKFVSVSDILTISLHLIQRAEVEAEEVAVIDLCQQELAVAVVELVVSEEEEEVLHALFFAAHVV